MNNAVFNFEKPANEPVRSYVPGSRDRKLLAGALDQLSDKVTEIPLIISGKEVHSKNTGKLTMPHNYKHVVANYHIAEAEHVKMAIDAALNAKKIWENVSWVERLSVTVKIADLIAEKHRYLLNAATMLGQGKNVFQAEIDAVCETVDFLRFNAYYVSQIYNQQPHSGPGIINRIEYRPLEGFVFAITPFNFTSIASNLNMAPVLMGNTVVWKPATTSLLAGYVLMKIYREAGLPDGVINFIPGSGSKIGDIAFSHKDLGGVHFTGSTNTFHQIWKKVGENITRYKSYPRIVGETGGKDFIVVHRSAGIDEVATAIVRGAYEYQGQKCSAASRAYIPQSMWENLKKRIMAMVDEITVGDVRALGNFMNAVIDEEAYEKIMGYIDKAKNSPDAEVIFGGKGDKSTGYFIEPTMIVAKDPHFITMEEEIFGPVMSVYVYNDDEFDQTLDLVNNTSPYALTGSIFSQDREALNHACRVLRYAAGNLYFNDKPTGAMVGQQPFGGARASGTNDKAGSRLNLTRWASPRTIKETLIPDTDFKYPFMKEDRC